MFELTKTMRSYAHNFILQGGYYFWIPMIAPFIGCLFGGLLYDIFIYTGPSPINSPYFGLMDVVKPKQSVQKRMEDHKKDNIV